ncbi:MAG: hypothetical protein PHV18_00670 [Lachnospiraceae bacterium]|nr:hypothetical protein [Lachnospiraceae bacterium]
MKKRVIIACVLLAAGFFVLRPVFHWNNKSAVAVSIIGGADGPTSVFLAGKAGKGAREEEKAIPATSSNMSLESRSSESTSPEKQNAGGN